MAGSLPSRRSRAMAARRIRPNRDLLFVAVPATLLVVGAVTITLLLMRPAPPSELVMSTGTADGMYHAYATKYRDILARDGVTLRLAATVTSRWWPTTSRPTSTSRWSKAAS